MMKFKKKKVLVNLLMTQTWEGAMKRRSMMSKTIHMTSRKAMLEMELNQSARS